MRALALLGAVVVSGCATLNTANMSEPCARVYNACLNACPKADAPPPTAISPEWRMDTAECVDQCNKQAKSCQ